MLVCPKCGTSKTAEVAKFKGSKNPLEIECKCASTYPVFLEFRGAHRRETRLKGYYCRLPACKVWDEMLVKNLSLTGLGFSTFTEHGLRKGAGARVRFTLDDSSLSEIEKDVVVRLVRDNYLGCEFADPSLFDKALGFYLMP